MRKEKKLTQSEIDGVQYRRAKLWQIILYSCNAMVGMTVYSLIGMASYSASVGYGISTAVIGIILTCTRIFDGVTDPVLAIIYDKVDTKFGRLRVLLLGGFVIEAIALLAMFDVFSWNRCVYVVICNLRYWLYNYKYDSADITGNYDK